MLHKALKYTTAFVITLGLCGCGVTGSGDNASAADGLDQTIAEPANFLIGLCIIPEEAKFENCNKEELLAAAGPGEPAAYVIFRANYSEAHVASPSVNSEGLMTFEEKINTTPVEYVVGSDGSKIILKTFRNGCNIQRIYEKSGEVIYQSEAVYEGDCGPLPKMQELARLSSNSDGSPKPIRYTTGN